MKPIIGLTCSITDGLYTLRDAYAKAIVRAGGIPVILTYESEPAVSLAAIDGILLTGGDDIHPRFYGDNIHPETTGISELRDSYELDLLSASVAADLPVLCICRGMQIMNVYSGGTLAQHIENHKKPAVQTHTVKITPGSLLAGIMGSLATVNSRHHQAALNLGSDVNVTAIALDGTIEALEFPLNRFALGVQWHPEDMLDEYPSHLPLFKALVHAAKASHI